MGTELITGEHLGGAHFAPGCARRAQSASYPSTIIGPKLRKEVLRGLIRSRVSG
jgi:hypothetical protein